MEIKTKIFKALNKQVGMELGAFYSYLVMSVYFESCYMPGAARWFKTQSNEEFNHALKISSYILARGGTTDFTAIEAPEAKWESCLSVFEDAYAQELNVSEHINELVELAQSEHDHATAIMLQWFVTEQVEEEDTAKKNVERFKRIKNAAEGVAAFDIELGLRK
jgi:ferritin